MNFPRSLIHSITLRLAAQLVRVRCIAWLGFGVHGQILECETLQLVVHSHDVEFRVILHIAVGQFDIPTLDRGPSPGFWGVDRSVGTCALQTEAIRAIIKVVIYAFIMCSLFFGLVAGFNLP